MYPLIRRYLRRVDVVYLLLCAACSAISIAVLLSIGQTQLGSNNKASVQLIASLLGLMLAVVFSTADYHALARAWPLHGVVAWGLVLLCVNNSDKLKSWQKTVIILLVCVITFPSDDYVCFFGTLCTFDIPFAFFKRIFVDYCIHEVGRIFWASDFHGFQLSFHYIFHIVPKRFRNISS